MRNPNKINWNAETWQQYIGEALETAENLRKLGAKNSAPAWDEIAIERDSEHKRFIKPTIPYS